MIRLLEQLCCIHSPSGEEYRVRDFIINYVKQNSKNWRTKPQLLYGDDFQDNLILVFGEPKSAIISHIDTMGFTVSYNNEIIPIGSPDVDEYFKLKSSPESNYNVYGEKKNGVCEIAGNTPLPVGTTLTFQNDLSVIDDFVLSPYLDNRLGIYIALKAAEQIKNGIIAFTAFEEHHSGGAELVPNYIYHKYNIRKIYVNDVTSVSNGIKFNEGAVISIRDVVIPRRKFVDEVIAIAQENTIKFQLEVEGVGASDGAVIQKMPYHIDWCFVGVAGENIHSQKEKVHKKDISEMIDFLRILMNAN